MKLIGIITKRKTEKWPSYDLVYEWEDIFKERLYLKFYNHILHSNKYSLAFHAKFPKRISRLFVNKAFLQFEMLAHDYNLDRTGINRYSIVPWIIDSYTDTTERIKRLEHNYSSNCVVLISSREVYDRLVENGCNLPIRHLALSLPDQYAISRNPLCEKDYDAVFVGRKNPVFREYLDRYAEEHPSFSYLYNDYLDGHFVFFNQKGEVVGDSDTREQYWAMIKRARVALYSTVGMDGDKSTNGFHHVTPRFLEFVAAGAHIIARYQDNSDTNYFELNKICHKIETYQEFVEIMGWSLTNRVDMDMYSEYLKKHYTSVRVKQLCDILRHI